jgi:hypothetical protein
MLTLAAATAEAYPILQLDIIGGHYDAATETIVSGGPDFVLVALLSHADADLLADTYYISAAVSPNPGPAGGDLGNFSWNGTNYDVTDDMTYGTPPLEASGATHDGGDLPGHGIFPTFFREFSFQFSTANRTEEYNTEDNPSGLTPTSATTNVAYYALFNITTGLTGDNVLHFDLYNSAVRRNGDEDVDRHAPFSHDAESSNQKVAEPGSMLLMSMGLLFAARSMRRLKKA